jgi:hypothetical protein
MYTTLTRRGYFSTRPLALDLKIFATIIQNFGDASGLHTNMAKFDALTPMRRPWSVSSVAQWFLSSSLPCDSPYT